MEKFDTMIIGGGPAGLMAAIRAASFGQNVALLEKNPSVGEKLLLSGRGRCNFTNALISRYGESWEIRSALRSNIKALQHERKM